MQVTEDGNWRVLPEGGPRWYVDVQRFDAGGELRAFDDYGQARLFCDRMQQLVASSGTDGEVACVELADYRGVRVGGFGSDSDGQMDCFADFMCAGFGELVLGRYEATWPNGDNAMCVRIPAATSMALV